MNQIVPIEDIEINKERDKKIVLFIRQDLPYSEIGEKFNLTKARISQIALKNGIIKRPMDINIDYWNKVWAVK
jgi:DNA-directed RNA polymerase specialized sigma subunit